MKGVSEAMRLQRMNALVWLGPREMQWREVPEAGLAAGEVRLRVEAAGICGSELSGYLGKNSLRVPPLVMGHEFCGVVVEVGEGVDMTAGDRVVVNPLLSCGRCDPCRSGRENLCLERALIGAHRPGGFAERVVVPASACSPLPPALDFVAGALCEPLACAVRAVSLAASGRPSPGSLHVVGAGPIGSLCALLGTSAGFEQVTIFDPNPARMAVAEAWGLTGSAEGQHAADAIIDAVGLEATRREAVAAVRRGGTVVFVGLHSPATAFDGNELVRDEKVVRGCFAYTRADFARALEILAEGFVPAPSGWVEVRELEGGRVSFEELTGPSPASLKIVLRLGGAKGRPLA